MTWAIYHFGPLGVLLLMIPESACIPIPSEVTLMAAGFGVHQGLLAFPAAVAAATLGNLIGSSIAYWVGRGRLLTKFSGEGTPLINRCRRLFERHGDSAVFLARLMPLARSFVSMPAGHFRVPILRFVGLTLAGCAIWCTAFVLAGDWTGSAWQTVSGTVGRASLAIGALLVLWLLLGAPLRRSNA
jgi:membrane protein DedA with SNARE-associated domain